MFVISAPMEKLNEFSRYCVAGSHYGFVFLLSFLYLSSFSLSLEKRGKRKMEAKSENHVMIFFLRTREGEIQEERTEKK